MLLYVASYGFARTQKILIHRVCYETSTDGSKRFFHSVNIGDFGVPMLSGAGLGQIGMASKAIHSPLRMAETLFWRMYPREYTF